MTTKHTMLLIAMLALLTTYAVVAEDETPGTDANKKTAVPDDQLRDPFWPIAWQPKDWGRTDDNQKLEGLKRWESAIKEIKLSGISKDKSGNFFVVVRGQGVKETGDIITADYGGLTYTWVIRKITEKGIVPEQLQAVPTKQ